MRLKPGDTIDRYEVVALLGQGGMGEVYRAIDTRLRRPVALKILLPDAEEQSPSSLNSEGSARMVREARAAAALDHVNVISVYDVGQIDVPGPLFGTTFIAMELVRGTSLRDRIGEVGVPMSERVRWLIDIAKALSAAHAVGLIHRDMKPENVMVRDDGTVKVLDFGIAKATHAEAKEAMASTVGSGPATTEAGLVLGTPLYMAPEQMRAERLDSRTDQYSWGVLAYELLTGRFPWSLEGGTLALVLQKLSTVPNSVRDYCDVPEGVAAAVARTLERDREGRFPSMQDVVLALGGEAEALARIDSQATPRVFYSPRSLQPSYGDPSLGMAATTASGALSSTVAVPSEIILPARGTTKSPAPERPARPRWLLGVGALAFLAVVGGGAYWRAKSHRDAAASDLSALPASVAECTVNSQCVRSHGGAPWICRPSDGRCVAIASEDCTPKFEPPDLDSDDTLWIGSMFPLTGPRADAYGKMHADGADFARREIAQMLGSLSGEQRVRPFALLSCNDANDGNRAAKHLVEDLGVPAVIGFQSTKELLDIAQSLLIPRGVLTIATISVSPLVTDLLQARDQPRSVWRTSYNYAGMSPAASLFLERSLTRASDKTRVAVLRGDSPVDAVIAESLFKTLRFNGKSALENGADYQEVIVAAKDGDGGLDKAAKILAAFAPSVVVSSAPPDVADVAGRLEAQSAVRPTYLMINGSPSSLKAFIDGQKDRRRRVFGIVSPSASMPNARFVIRYNAANAAQVTRELNPASTYDAMYLLAYASAASPKVPIRGPVLAKAFGRLVGAGSAIEVGPSQLFQGIGRLNEGEPINLEGAMGSLDFDLRTGDWPSDFVLLCARRGADGKVDGDLETGLVYRAHTRAVEGELRCP